MLPVVVVLVAIIAANASGQNHTRYYSPLKYWNGWPSVENMYIFGDSWTDTSFNTSGPFPSHDSPLGNPFYPKLNATYGAKWPVYLTTQYNNSLIETYAFAKDGSVVNSNIDPGRADLIGQVQQQFLPLWGSRNDSTWQPYNTLFAVFIGINDVNIAVSCENDTSTTFEEIMVTYSSLVDQLYQTGARNFLFLDVPPLDRAPQPEANVGPAVLDWNTRVGNLASNLSITYADTTVFQFDTHNLFNEIFANVTYLPMTAQLKNLTDWCLPYNWIFQNKYDPSCGVPLDGYMWMNSLHPTYPMHDAIASQIPLTLDGPGTWENGNSNHSISR